MTPFTVGLSPLWNDLGVVLGFALSLFLFSYLVKENLLARLAQYVLVGASLGYAGVLIVKNVLAPRLLAPLFAPPLALQLQETLATPPLLTWWIPLGLGLLLWLGGIEAMRRPPGPQGSTGRKILRLAGVLPVALLLGTGLGVGIAGAIQGTLAPQFLRAAALGLPGEEVAGPLLTGLLTLVVTGGALLHLRAGGSRLLQRGPGRLLAGWAWIGQRALWLAAGLIFARLLAARLSLLVAQLNYFATQLQETGLWQWLMAQLR